MDGSIGADSMAVRLKLSSPRVVESFATVVESCDARAATWSQLSCSKRSAEHKHYAKMTKRGDKRICNRLAGDGDGDSMPFRFYPHFISMKQRFD